jgi:hypothetical protein
MWAKQGCTPARNLTRKGNGSHYTFRIWGLFNCVQNLTLYFTKINVHLILRRSYTSFKLLLRCRFHSKTLREFLISLLELPNPHTWTPRLFVKLQPAVAVVPAYGFCTLKLILCIQRQREKLLLFFRMSLCVLPALFTLYEYYKSACLHAVANAEYRLQYFIITLYWCISDPPSWFRN